MENRFLIWYIEGGLGKNIAATSLLQDIKEKYPDRTFLVVCSYPELFLHNPFVDRVLQIENYPYFYSDYIDGKDTLIFKYNPYDHTGYITRTKHIIECWCDILGLEYKKQFPKIYFNYAQSSGSPHLQRNKPILILQTTGGPSFTSEREPALPYNWNRDIPLELANSIVDKFSNKYHIIHLTRDTGYVLQGVERLVKKLSNTGLVQLLLASKKRILIDSSLQHISAALQVKSDVIWVGTSPVNFGYDINNNITAKPTLNNKHLIDSHFLKYSLTDNLVDCPYKTLDEMFDVKEVLSRLGN